RMSLKRSMIGGVLSTEECLNVANTIYGGRKVKSFISQLDEELPILKEKAEQIIPLKELEMEIKNCIDDHGQVMDSASQSLRGIRSSIRSFEAKVREKLESYTRSNSKMLSDSIVTIRN